MEHFPPMYTDEEKMIAQTIRRFVDQEIMPVIKESLEGFFNIV